MNWKTTMCLTLIGLLVIGGAIGCGRRSKGPVKERDYAAHFEKRPPLPSDSSVRISALNAQPRYPTGSAVELNVHLQNAGKGPRSLPIGVESDEGFSYSYFWALVRDESGKIERVTFPDYEGELVTLKLGDPEQIREIIPIGHIYDFDEPGIYRIVMFYEVPNSPLPNGEKPDWHGTTWTSSFAIRIE
jgi:hypothetical protein